MRAAWGLIVLLAVALPAHAQRPQVLIVERTYDGPIERAGDVYAWRYSGGMMYLEFGDASADGIFRSGFEGASIVIPCLPESGVVCP